MRLLHVYYSLREIRFFAPTSQLKFHQLTSHLKTSLYLRQYPSKTISSSTVFFRTYIMDPWFLDVHEQRFKYRPLDVEDGIRLVTLFPASFHEPIACTLFHTELSSNPSYEALSYTWGNHQNLVSIMVSGKSFGITHNLATALRYLRRKEREVTFWIDAICINQENTDERTQQVALMTNIYQRARQVQIWLGSAADDSEMVRKFFGKFVEKPMKLVNQSLLESYSTEAWIYGRAHAFLEPCRTFLEHLVSWSADDWTDEPVPTEGPTLDETQWLRGYIVDKSRIRLRQALEALLERDYWYRAWVIQEILMASSITLNCGSNSVPWECVTTVVKAFMESGSHRLYGPTPWRSPLNSFRTRNMRLATFETIGHLASVRLDGHTSRGPEWLLQMLLKLRHFRATDPRDKVFSLLGLINRKLFQSSPSEPPILSVDYNLTFFQVSMRLFKYCVLAPSHSSMFENETSKSRLGGISQDLHKGSLNILCASQPTNRPEGFPSWLPDFSRDNGMEHWPCYESYQYSRFVGAGPGFSLNDTLLEVLGVVVTTLKHGYVTDKDDDTQATDVPCLLTRIWTFMSLAEARDSSVLATDAFWSALQLGRDSGEMVRTALRAFLDWRLGIKRTDSVSASSLFEILEEGIEDRTAAVVSFLNNFRRGSLHRRFAMMRTRRKLRPAMVPADARPGDGLFLLRGSDYPVLLRPVGDAHNNFEFVGPCFIPGWDVISDASYYGHVKRIILR